LDQATVSGETERSLIRDRTDVLIFVLAALAVIIAAFSYGRSANASRERNQSATVDEENRYFCTGLGFIAATALYQKCCDGPMAIRSRHEERIRQKLGAI
jgi:hypothetical protein